MLRENPYLQILAYSVVACQWWCTRTAIYYTEGVIDTNSYRTKVECIGQPLKGMGGRSLEGEQEDV